MSLIGILLYCNKEISFGIGVIKVQFDYKPLIGKIKHISGKGLVEKDAVYVEGDYGPAKFPRKRIKNLRTYPLGLIY